MTFEGYKGEQKISSQTFFMNCFLETSKQLLFNIWKNAHCTNAHKIQFIVLTLVSQSQS